MSTASPERSPRAESESGEKPRKLGGTPSMGVVSPRFNAGSTPMLGVPPDTQDIPPDRPRLSIVIPSYNGRHLLETCLASIERCRPSDFPVEVIVSDDASNDDTADWLATHHPNVRLLLRDRNGGFCASANTGIAAARGEFIQLLNNDTEVTPGWIESGLAPFSDPTVGSVAPLVLVRSDPSRVDSAGDGFAFFGWPFKRGHGEPASKWSHRPPEPVFAASGSSAFYRLEALRQVGGFDPLFGSYYEDLDLGFRLRWAGYSCLFTPSCLILHEVSATHDHTLPDLQRRISRNAEVLYWSNLPPSWLLLSLLPHFSFTLLQASVRACRGTLLPFLSGKLDALRLWRSLVSRRSDRAHLRRSASHRPRFPMTITPFSGFRNHIRRPRESFERLSGSLSLD